MPEAGDHRDRRAHQRIPLELKALVSGDGAEARRCTVRDFCPGGMYLVPGDGSGRDPVWVTPGETVEIHFSVHEGGPVTGKRHAFRLAAKVAHMRGPGFGIAFLHPEPVAVQALLDLSRRRHPEGAAAREEPGRPALDRVQILGRFRDRVAKRLRPLVEGFFHRVGDALVSKANWARSNAEEAHFFDAVTQLRKLRDEILGAYDQLILEQIVELGDPGGPEESAPLGTGPGGLTLVDEREFEDWVAMASVITRAEVDHRLPLYEIEQRLSDVAGTDVDRENNPVGPAILCRSFRDALEGVVNIPSVREVIYRVFAEEVLARLDPLYGELNQLLAESGARLESERPRPAEESPAPPPAAAAPAESAPAPLQEAIYRAFSESVRGRLGDIFGELDRVLGPADADGGGATGDPPAAREALNRLFSESMVGLMDEFHDQLRHLLAGDEAPAPPPRAPAAPPAAGAAPTADAYRAARELLHLRRALPATPVPGAGPAAAVRAYTLAEIQAALDSLPLPAGADLRETLLAALTRQPRGDSRTPRAFAPQESDAIETVQALFDGIRADAVLDEGVRAELGRLDQPLLQLALKDPAFLASADHPARQALEQAYRLGVAASGGGWSDPRLGKTLTEVVERIRDRAQEDTGVYQESLAPLAELTGQQQEARRQRVERVIRECEGRQRSDKALRATNAALDERLAGRTVPTLVLELLDAGWRALLRLTCTREGTRSDAWKRYLGTLDELLALLAAAGTPGAEPSPEAERVLAEVAHGLGEICFDQFRCNQVQEALRRLLVPAPEGPPPAPPETVDLPAAEPPGAKLEALARQHGAWLARARELRPGEWLFLAAEDGEAKPLELVWKGEEAREFVFADRRGLKAASRTLAALAEDLHAGVATLIGDRDLPVMDRTMREMVQQMSQQLIFHATHDLLTGLLNRKEFAKRLDQALSEARLERTQHMLLHLDLDQFAVTNMTAGREAGDALLQEVARLLGKALPEECLLGRVGDDEFGILQPESTPELALELAETLRHAIHEHRFQVDGQQRALTASIGLATVGEQSPGVDELLVNAGTACGGAKAAGGNRCQLYRPDDSELQHRRGVMQWLTRINAALDEDQLVLRCQQIAPLSGDAQRHYEILISYQDPAGRLAAPSEFIEAAELYNRMADVDRWVIRKVFQWMSAHRHRLDQFGSFAINLSGNSLNDEAFLQYVLAEFESTGVPPERVCFEITETATVANLASAAAFMGRLKEVGCRFSLDDFGSGLSSYSYLKNLPVDYLKIDGMFIRDIVDNPSDFAVVKSINEIAHFLGMKTIAEYAESDAIIERLREMGVDFAQGYAVERPLLLAAY